MLDQSIYENFLPLKADLHGFNQYDSHLFGDLISKLRPSTIIEIGTWKGASAFTMCKAIKKNGLKTKIFCVDTWLGALEFIDKTQQWLENDFHRKERDLMLKNGYPQVYYQFLSNVIHTDNQNIIIPIPNTSDIAARFFKNNSIKADLIFVDGSHDYEDVKRDIQNYYELLLNDESIIFGDDYRWHGVNKAVSEFSNEKGVKVEVINNNFWIM